MPVGEMDIVVSMAPVRAAALVPRGFKGKTMDWKVDDPVGKSLTVFRRVRGEIETRVRELVEQVRREAPHAHRRH